MPGDEMPSARAARLLRAIAGELEAALEQDAVAEPDRLTSHLALVATLLAEHLEGTEAEHG
jgi:hypothetical protein